MEKIMLFIKHNFGFVWVILEWFNGFLFSIRYSQRLSSLGEFTECDSHGYIYRSLNRKDIPSLFSFFKHQPLDQYEFFKPHEFDEKSLEKMFNNKAFLMFGCFDGDKLIAYYFLRCFFIGKAFRGKMVEINYRGKGIAKMSGKIMTKVCSHLQLRQFATISKDNIASIMSSKAVNNIISTKELKDGYFCIEYGEKED